jgi:pimeloyl-ACP methyl ester carboxylesterase
MKFICVMMVFAGLLGCAPARVASLPSAAAAAATPGPIPAGSGQFTLSGAEPLTVFTYKPRDCTGGPLLVVFHGVGRNAADYRDHAIVMGDRFKAIVAAPLFAQREFPHERYQMGGVLRKGRLQPQDQWTYAFIPKLVDQVRAMEGRPDLPYCLIGHSAGGQFVDRMAAFLPGGASRIVAANPGTLLFPSRGLAFPIGFGGLPQSVGGDDAIRAYLAAPLTLYLGTGDVVQDRDFERSPEAMQQGSARLYRGRACFELARKVAAEHGWPCNWRKVEIAGVGHNATRMFAGMEVGDALFGPGGAVMGATASGER